MPKALVIVESPAKAKTINKYLGKQLRRQSLARSYQRSPQERPGGGCRARFRTAYEVIEGKRKLISELKPAAKKVDDIYLAADPDREGEAICYHLQEELQDKKDGPQIFRVMFNEITKKAIEKAFENPGR